ncbi:putative NEFA-interacting nuclear protein NIP30 [Rosellinia necatrix]|uniref:Putative NEFA-interacting nuclear protein NIP30 n=1 Tax=Rosellinia necatrix TaxID=77044 RepID=A0A1S7UHZ3_ROSNE|nr:putative NEFA-interacting nuclear protein NIP30 [Rosellinia necatrix]
MTSRFVSGGTIAGDGGAEGEDRPGTGATTETRARAGIGSDKAAVEWEAVQRDLEEERRRRVEARKATVEGSGERSLYEVLQANKAAKQAAFEEQNRIRNQFRALDDDEIEFLHGVSDEKHAEEERVRRETEARLASFRKAQRSAEGGSGGDDDAGHAADIGNGGAVFEEWGSSAGRKRKREKEKAGLKGVRRRTSMPNEDVIGPDQVAGKATGEGKGGHGGGNSGTKLTPTKLTHASIESEPAAAKGAPTTSSTPAMKPQPQSQPQPKPRPALGLVDYGSDEDDD